MDEWWICYDKWPGPLDESANGYIEPQSAAWAVESITAEGSWNSGIGSSGGVVTFIDAGKEYTIDLSAPLEMRTIGGGGSASGGSASGCSSGTSGSSYTVGGVGSGGNSDPRIVRKYLLKEKDNKGDSM